MDTVIGVSRENKTYFSHNGSGLIPINNGPDFLRLEGSQIYTRVSGYLLRSIQNFTSSKTIIGGKVGHVMFDKIATFELESAEDIKIANYINDIL